MLRKMMPIGLIALFATSILAQVATFGGGTPFFTTGAVAAQPQIGFAVTGEDLQVQSAIVSPDRKYVTLDLNPTFSTIQGFQTFTYQTSSGFVGSAPNTGTPAPAPATFLDRPGMTRVAELH
jgi:hypothetical protein